MFFNCLPLNFAKHYGLFTSQLVLYCWQKYIPAIFLSIKTNSMKIPSMNRKVSLKRGELIFNNSFSLFLKDSYWSHLIKWISNGYLYMPDPTWINQVYSTENLIFGILRKLKLLHKVLSRVNDQRKTGMINTYTIVGWSQLKSTYNRGFQFTFYRSQSWGGLVWKCFLEKVMWTLPQNTSGRCGMGQQWELQSEGRRWEIARYKVAENSSGTAIMLGWLRSLGKK